MRERYRREKNRLDREKQKERNAIWVSVEDGASEAAPPK